MAKRIVILCLLVFVAMSAVFAWGFWGHKQINKIAIYTLPVEMFGLYKANMNYLVEQAVVPDSRRYIDPREAPRHYLDLDYYSRNKADSLPHSWNKAKARFSEDTLQAYGIVPWHIYHVFLSLTQAFKDRNESSILSLSAHLGHYVADAHVPLHTTENYNGQMTNQYGIHGFWESRVPELLGDEYDYFIGKAVYIEHPQEYAWQIVLDSHSKVDSVLLFEQQLAKDFPSDKKYAYEQRGGKLQKTYSEAYSIAYNELLHNMAERRMRDAILAVGSYWYTAWVNAGQPSLKDLNKGTTQYDTTTDSTSVVKTSKGHAD